MIPSQIQALIDKWRQNKCYCTSFCDCEGMAYQRCADDLEAALLASPDSGRASTGQTPAWFQAEREYLHALIADQHAALNPEAHPDLARRAEAILLRCDKAGACVAVEGPLYAGIDYRRHEAGRASTEPPPRQRAYVSLNGAEMPDREEDYQASTEPPSSDLLSEAVNMLNSATGMMKLLDRKSEHHAVTDFIERAEVLKQRLHQAKREKFDVAMAYVNGLRAAREAARPYAEGEILLDSSHYTAKDIVAEIDDLIAAHLKPKDSAASSVSPSIGTEQEQGWQPIETAPKDGESIIVWPLRVFASWDARFKAWICDDDGGIVMPTHWYPAPPKLSPADPGGPTPTTGDR